jgi:hypothetical protein
MRRDPGYITKRFRGARDDYRRAPSRTTINPSERDSYQGVALSLQATLEFVSAHLRHANVRSGPRTLARTARALAPMVIPHSPQVVE